MEQFLADLHIHSRYSRATSKQLDPRVLAAWARVKGLHVIGTGDFTHPGWRKELAELLEPDPGSGLFRLKDTRNLTREIPFLDGYELAGRTLFMLQAEISSIYKKNGAVRKVHNLVYVPTMEAADKLSEQLAAIGNIESDGRPILGLDSRNLLEMVVELDPLAFLVPAHIWTPWFSLFGSKSGFNSLEECYGDLSSHIFALETGLSSDPEMNWMLSALDRYALISNSDAHSGEKLARECNIFSGERSYEGIFRALRGEALGHKFQGTVEFFPEEGKYHLDGHRKCGVALEPRETLSRGGICPVCGKPLTVGVLHRVLDLADRDTPEKPDKAPGFESLIPLAEVLSEIVGAGPTTKKVRAMYTRCISRIGSEMAVLRDAPPEELARVSAPLAEAVSRMRRGEVIRNPGFDGEFGVIRVFSEKERKELHQGTFLVPDSYPAKKKRSAPAPKDAPPASEPADTSPEPEAVLESEAPTPAEPAGLNPEQQTAVLAGPGPVLVKAGPGTGKTHTLLARIEHLIAEGSSPRHILAVTFTRKAARELSDRLVASFGSKAALPRADTLHALAHEVWRNAYDEAPVVLSEEAARRVFRESNTGSDLDSRALDKAFSAISLARERRDPLGEELEPLFHRYVKQKESWNLADYTDLLEFWLEQIEHEIYPRPYTHVLVDEVQDFSRLQIDLVRALLTAPAAEQIADELNEPGSPAGRGLFAIGDPDQSIYGFRGALAHVEEALREVWPHLEVIGLSTNYRSSQSILDLAARALIQGQGAPAPLTGVSSLAGQIRLFEAPSAESEAAWVGERIRALLGATSHTLADRQHDEDKAEGLGDEQFSPGDIAVLVRVRSQIAPLARTLDRLGLPVSVPETEAFWEDPRVAAILAAAGGFLGISRPEDDPESEKAQAAKPLPCPDDVLASGPSAIASYMQDVPPFDRLFWKSRAFKELAAGFEEHGGWLGLINWINLQSSLEQVRRASEKVQIMTLHAAKGLEFRAVFLPGLEEGVLPFAGPGLSAIPETPGPSYTIDLAPDQLAEELRLFYVGLTRAREALYLSRAGSRTVYGRTYRLPASRFLGPLADGENAIRRSTLIAKTQRTQKHLSLMD
ncbi:UvrD-helicase domain-containing protein [Oceanidesulfovibrio marinus]|uniref:DNA helicase UvrD n=1 Tax=Oceanidesulfovibrio marinus TaxID=370038 RepID=A0A6P1ZJA9_9BACT|nr:UvrD-helicase domain-containing protein [Oceanidesulfovibrio marinus]TVM35673.1 DNA helicase UvrD [Oceanidesulfovibrio marinus]